MITIDFFFVSVSEYHIIGSCTLGMPMKSMITDRIRTNSSKNGPVL